MAKTNSWMGKGAVVTGGSRGIGAALGFALAREGARVVLVAREVAPLEHVVAESGLDDLVFSQLLKRLSKR